MKPTNSIYTGLPTTIFEEMSRLAMAHKAVNLGQGFPDVDGPEDIRAKAAEALIAGPNQYPPMLGLPELRQAVAANWRRFHGLEVDPAREVLVTSGATEALSDAINALIEPGDEVVLIEPLYDCYLPLVKRAGGVPRLVRVTPPDWALDDEALAAAFSPRTKAVLLNNPMNPAAKVFSREELALIAELAIRHDAYVIADEVYEHIVFDGAQAISMLSLPGMRERTVAIGSAGKSFSLTGWKVGYVTAAPALLDPIAKAHQFTTFTTPPNLQKAVAYGLAKDDGLFRRPGRRACRRSATGSRSACAGARAGGHPLPGHVFPHPRHGAARPRRRRRRACPADDDRGRRHRRAGLGLLRAPTRRATTCASASPSATRCSTRPWSAWRGWIDSARRTAA